MLVLWNLLALQPQEVWTHATIFLPAWHRRNALRDCDNSPSENDDWRVLNVVKLEICIRLFEGASFSPERLHNRPEAARYLLNLVTACSDRDTHTLSKFS
jgi:hypothetical protein